MDNTTSIDEFIETSNQRLMEAGALAAEAAFGVVSWLGVIVSGLALLIALVLVKKNWIILAIIAVGLMMAAIVLASVLAARAKAATLRAAYEREIAPAIEQFLQSHAVAWQEFERRARQTLPEDAPLCNSLKIPLPQGENSHDNPSTNS